MALVTRYAVPPIPAEANGTTTAAILRVLNAALTGLSSACTVGRGFPKLRSSYDKEPSNHVGTCQTLGQR